MTKALLAAADPVIRNTRTYEIPKLHAKDNLRYVGVEDVRENIEKTNSLTSPYLGDVSVEFTCTCDLDDFDRQLGLQHHTSTEYRTFTFGWQGGQWVLTHTDFNPPH